MLAIKKIRGRTIQNIAPFFYHTNFPFSTCFLDYFKEMIEAIKRYGGGLKPSSYYGLWVSLLKKRGRLYKWFIKRP